MLRRRRGEGRVVDGLFFLRRGGGFPGRYLYLLFFFAFIFALFCCIFFFYLNDGRGRKEGDDSVWCNFKNWKKGKTLRGKHSSGFGRAVGGEENSVR